MSDNDGTYAPKSPDLSSFLLSGGGEAQPQTSIPNESFGSYLAPYQPKSEPYVQPQTHSRTHQPGTYNHDLSPYTPVRRSQPNPYGHVQTPQSPYDYDAQTPLQPPSYWSYPTPTPSKSYEPPVVPPHSTGQGQLPVAFAREPKQEQLQEPEPKPEPEPEQATTSKPSSTMPPRKAVKVEEQAEEIDTSPVKTKFPTARIKRIMQADEEVGKVAQQTPIAVGKALELFMVDIVRHGAEVAKDKNSKRITAHMLRQAVEANQQWDFLQEIVSKVSEKEESAKSGKAKAEATDSDEDFEAAEAKKKPARGGGRKKKAAAP